MVKANKALAFFALLVALLLLVSFAANVEFELHTDHCDHGFLNASCENCMREFCFNFFLRQQLRFVLLAAALALVPTAAYTAVGRIKRQQVPGFIPMKTVKLNN